MIGRKIPGLVAALTIALMAPVAAQAETSAHHAPGSPSTTVYNETFAASGGGWTSSTSYDGLCVPALLCPNVTNGPGTGGAAGGGDGYVRTSFLSLLSTLAGTSTGVLASPAFTYNGNGGKAPAVVGLDLSIRPQVQALLGLSAVNDTSYRVDLYDAATGGVVNVIPVTKLTNDSAWTTVPTAFINPTLLTIGHSYKVVISTIYHATATVVATGEVGYDNVRLVAAGHLIHGSHSISRHDLIVLIQHDGLNGNNARMKGHLVKFRVKCPAGVKHNCTYRLHGLAKGKHSPRATSNKTLKIKSGKSKVVKLRIKPGYFHRFQHAHKILIKARVQVGKTRAVVYKRFKLLH